MDGEQSEEFSKGVPSEVTLKIVFDNYECNPELKTGWGFGCLAQVDGKNVLFDTGADGATVIANMQQLKINPEAIDHIVLSHPHREHTGGLMEILKHNKKVNVFLPQSFPLPIREKVVASGARCINVNGPVRIDERVYSTGELKGRVIEQSMIISISKGIVVLTGCAHAGIIDVLKKAKELSGRNIYMALGGFHLKDVDEKSLRPIINELRLLGVKKIAPCHCSGDICRKVLKSEFGADFINAGVGKVIEV